MHRMLTSFPTRLAIATIAALTVLAACQGLPRGQDGVSSVQFQDVVVPDGLKIVDNAHQSHTVEAASYRNGRLVYTGAVRAEDAVAYVRERLPLHNWTLVQEDTANPDRTKLRFERGYYVQEYLFTRRDGKTEMVVDYTTDYSDR